MNPKTNPQLSEGEKFLIFLVKVGFVVGLPFLLIASLSTPLSSLLLAPYAAIVDFIWPSMGCKSIALLLPVMMATNGAVLLIASVAFRCVNRRPSDPDTKSESN